MSFLIPVYNNMPNDNEVILPDDEDKEEEIVTTPNIDVNTGVVGAGFKIDGDVLFLIFPLILMLM